MTLTSTSVECLHERGHITDSMFYRDRYSTPSSREIFCDICRKQRWLTIEAALATAQAELGIIPQDVAYTIARTATVSALDLQEVQAETDRSGHSLVGLLRVFEAACGEAGQYIHYGATTQDIQDTAQALEMRDVLSVLEPKLRSLVERLAGLAEEHALTPALGRTHARPALPMGFGLKIASWVDELQRHGERLQALRERVLVAQLFGGAGTMAGLGPLAPQVLAGFAARLGLGVPTVGWHVARDRVVEFVSALGMVTGTLARIADEIRVISRPEFGEVEEGWRMGKVGSSTMPHKRNPERCEQVVVMARLAAAQVGLALTGMIGDHERDSRALRVEWACVPDVAHYCLSACELTVDIISGLRVHTDRLLQNMLVCADEVMSERLMLEIGEQIGKQRAHELVYLLTQEAYESRVPLHELAATCTEIPRGLSQEALDRVFNPVGYLGASEKLTMDVVRRARQWLAESDRIG